MIDSTPSGAVADQGATGTAQLMVEADARRQAKKALQDADSEPKKLAGAVTLQGEDVLAGPEDGFDPLADGGEVRGLAGLIHASRSNEGDSKFLDSLGKSPAGVALVAKERLPTARAAGQKLKAHLPLVPLGRGQRETPESAVGGEDAVQAHPPEEAGVRGRPAVAGGVRKRGAQDRLPATRALHRGGVDEQEIIVETGAMPGKDAEEPLQGVTQSLPTLVVARLPGESR